MNNQRRKTLKNAICQIEMVKICIDSVLTEEETCMYNMPESLQDTDRYYEMEDATCSMEDAIESLTDSVVSIKEAIG